MRKVLIPRLVVVAVVVVAVAVLVTLGRYWVPQWFIPGVASTPSSSTGDDERSNIQILDGLAVAPGGPEIPYDRDFFGPAWSDTNHNGCDTRNDILRRDLVDVTFRSGTHDCVVTSGILSDSYSGETIEFTKISASAVQIDHIVPLAYAWHHGADQWTDAQRLIFANDPSELLAVKGAVNQSKSDKGPSEWLPPNEASWCMYARSFAMVTNSYHLSVSQTDYDVLAEILNDC